MKPVQSLRWLVLGVAYLVPFAVAQAPADSQPNPALERVLGQMDRVAASFRTAEAAVIWEQYQKVVDEHETQKGQVYQPKIEQVTVYNTGKNREEVESFLVLGFGGRGHDLLKSFQVKYLGDEKIGALDMAKLDLVPKAANVRNNVDHIVLWIDSALGISVQQQFFFGSSGDYRLAKYSDIKVNERISDSVFKLKTTGKTKIISPQS